MARETTMLDTADAITLEAEIDVPLDRWAGVVLAHPHPTFGGNMHATVTDALFEALPRHGIATVRFNFRGVGASGGEHDDGMGERLDIVAAIELLAMFVDEPIVLAGYSFGADVSLCVADTAPRRLVRGRAAAAHGGRPRLRRRERPPTEAPRGRGARSVQPTGRAREPRQSDWRNTELTVIPGGDHFLSGRLALVAEGCVEFVRTLS